MYNKGVMFGKPRYNKEKGVALCYSSRIVVTKNYREFRINKAYHDGMSESELYDATRGIWRRKIESVSQQNGLHYRGVLQHFLKMVFIPKCNVISQKLQVKTE